MLWVTAVTYVCQVLLWCKSCLPQSGNSLCQISLEGEEERHIDIGPGVSRRRDVDRPGTNFVYMNGTRRGQRHLRTENNRDAEMYWSKAIGKAATSVVFY